MVVRSPNLLKPLGPTDVRQGMSGVFPDKPTRSGELRDAQAFWVDEPINRLAVSAFGKPDIERTSPND